ncbi:MAG: hypothetical protein GY835_03250 [bacterium]|nr:hypothetical protein [bacterium]
MRHDLSVFIYEHGDALFGRFKYNTDVFDRDTIVRLCEQYRRTLEGVAGAPGRRIAEPAPAAPDNTHELHT